MNKEYAEYLLNRVKDDYDKIAEDFDLKRNYIPPDFKLLKNYIEKEEKMLDLGCGNGRLKEISGENIYYGADISSKLIEIARKRYPEGNFLLINPSFLPFEDGFFDKVFSLSVFHHIPSREMRIEFLKEIKRVLKPNHCVILTVWNLKGKKIKKLLIKYIILRFLGKSKLDYKDIFYPWKSMKGEVVIQRYIHVFSCRELRKLFKEAGFQIEEFSILKRSERGSNIFVVARKKNT